MEEKIRIATEKALSKLGAKGVVFAVEWPADFTHGDFAVNAALASAKSLGKNPRAVAEELAPLIAKALGKSVSAVSVAGPGFINITLAREVITKEIEIAGKKGRGWGISDTNKGKRIIVEYSNPNPFKEMHIGHMMSTIIGESISRIVETGGAKVFRDTYGGDVGPHVAKAIWGLQRSGNTEPISAGEVGEAYVKGAKAYEQSPELTKDINELNIKIYEGKDESVMHTWLRAREVCLEAFRELYKKLGTHFDYYFFESETAPIGMELVQAGLTKGIFEESEGAIIYRGEKKGLHTLVFITSHGTPTYETKDIGLAVLKEERCPSDESIIITANEQIGHFNVFLAALSEIAPLLAKKTSHIPHGFLRLTEGKMSSREGNVITADGLLATTLEKTLERNEDPIVAEQVAVGAVKYMVLRSASGSDIIFDVEKSLSLDGDSGPYLQYATVRAKSILQKAAVTKGKVEKPETAYLIERMLIRYPEIVARAERERAPHYITNYLTELASGWNSFYAQERIIGGDYEAYKLQIAQAFVTTMENGLNLLGIQVPHKM